MTCQEKILSEEYGELIFDFTADYAKRLQQENVCFTPVDDRYNIFYVRQQEIERYQGSLYLYQYLPKVYGLMAEEFDPISLESAGILAAQRPPLSLTGEGVVLAFIDTGIRFADSVFRDESGQSRIIGLWDQTLQSGTPPEGFSTAPTTQKRILMRRSARKIPMQKFLPMIPTATEPPWRA